MYLVIDVGGSKVLFAVFSEDGNIIAKHKIPSSKDYSQFLTDVRDVLSDQLREYQITHCCCALPGSIDRKSGSIIRLGNLDWQNVPIQADISSLVNGNPVLIENDAALGGLSEAIMLRDKYRKVLYIAPGTGIGSALIIDGKIHPDLADSESGHMVVGEVHGEPKTWEDLASGRSLLKRYGKLASELEDPEAWADFSHNFARGIQATVAVLLPEVVVLGAGVGAQLRKYETSLNEELEKLENNMVKIPPIVQAKRPEEAVVYGCYDLIKQHN